MLQINTGKLFTRGVGRTNPLRGVLYGNLRLPWERDIVTGAGTLRATGGGSHSRAIVYELEERIEDGEDGPGVLVSHTISPFLEDFSAVASFALNAIVSPDPDLTARLTSGYAGLASYRSPRVFIRRCFDEQIWIQDSEADEFVNFIEKLLALDRRSFLAAMRAIRTFVTGLHRLGDDLGLAYTLMVSAVESLAQDFDDYSSRWQDVDERKRVPIDKALRRTSGPVASHIRNAILTVEHASLSRRYREFTLKHVDAAYFRIGDAVIGRPVARYELAEALRQAYGLRSRYVHNLRTLPDELIIPHAHWETTYVERKPTLTFQGLSRLTRHVIKSFVSQGPVVQREAYDYTLEQAGIAVMRLAPEYWVGHPLVHGRQARDRLEGFLEQLIPLMSKAPDAKLTDLRPMLADVERLLPRAAKVHRPAMVALHAMFNAVVGPDQRTPRYSELLNGYPAETSGRSVETLIARTFFETTADWPIKQHQALHDAYLRQRSQPNGLHAPRLIDAAISLVLAERYRAAGDIDNARKLIATAVENHPGHEALQMFEAAFTAEAAIVWRAILIVPHSSPEAGAGNHTQV